MTLNSEWLEKALEKAEQQAARHGDNVTCSSLNIGYDEVRLILSAARSHLSALPPVDGLEVVAFRHPEAGWAHVQYSEIDMHCRKDGLRPIPLVTLPQASSVIAGLTKERDEAIRRGEDQWAGWVKEEVARKAAEARISSLEEENKRLREALTPSASTKAAYMGEFSIAIERHVNGDEEVDDEAEGASDPYEHVTVPWTTIKEIMAAIRAYAQTEDHNG